MGEGRIYLANNVSLGNPGGGDSGAVLYRQRKHPSLTLPRKGGGDTILAHVNKHLVIPRIAGFCLTGDDAAGGNAQLAQA